MSDQPDNLVLERLREIRQMLGRVREDTAVTRLRVGMLEAGYAFISLRLDRLAGQPSRRAGSVGVDANEAVLAHGCSTRPSRRLMRSVGASSCLWP
jgi:hypothetical protein